MLVRNYFSLIEKRVSILCACVSPHGIRVTRVVVVLQDFLSEEEQYIEDEFGRSCWSQRRGAK